MKKKIFTLFAFLACFMGANAVEVEVGKVDYTTSGKSTIGWKADMIQDDWITADTDGLHLYNPSVTENFYDYQLFITGNFSLDVDEEYTVKVVAKVSDGSAKVRYRFGSWEGFSDGEFDVTSTEYQEYPLTIKAPLSGCGLMVQFGDYVGTVSFKSVTVTHEESGNQQPAVWIPFEGFTNGDAETPWADPSVGALDAENNFKICAWGKENRGDPHPALIEPEEGNPSNHVFVVKATGFEENPWDNQFWIMMPRDIKDGEKLRISFRYKASRNVSRGIQGHGYPSEYRNNFDIGTAPGLAFTTEWQTYEWNGSWQNVWSIVWNLNESGDTEDCVFYFDDITVEELKLDHGWFVAGANTITGAVEYDYGNAIEFTQDGEFFVATVGTMGKENTWVNKVMISTVRGDDGSFRTATIQPTTQNIKSGEDEWGPFANASRKEIELPAQGVWKIMIWGNYITFIQLEGDEIVEKEPVDIITYKDEIVIEAVEREPTSQEQPADAENGIEAGTGNTWDNQFFIYSTRDLAPGVETIIEFEYKATNPARSTAAFQGIVAGNQDYITGAFNLENDDIFDTEWKSIKKELTMPEKKWDGTAVDVVQYITFDLACIKEANTYTFRNIKWYLKDDTLNEQNKTLENLINEDGSANFAIKVGAGTNPEFTGIESVVSDKKASNVTYNLAGQRVSKGYKGIVIKNGAKYIAK